MKLLPRPATMSGSPCADTNDGASGTTEADPHHAPPFAVLPTEATGVHPPSTAAIAIPPARTALQHLNDVLFDGFLAVRTGGDSRGASASCLYVADGRGGLEFPRDALPTKKSGSVRLVVISDTHGRHLSLGSRLPAGDVLVHCGDILMTSRFWSSGGRIEKVGGCDDWLNDSGHP